MHLKQNQFQFSVNSHQEQNIRENQKGNQIK